MTSPRPVSEYASRPCCEDVARGDAPAHGDPRPVRLKGARPWTCFGGGGMTDAATVQPDPREATRALTLWQPRPSLIVLGLKPFEFRRWPAPKSFVGRRNAIHSARRPCDAEELRAMARDPGDGHAWRALPGNRAGVCELRPGCLGLAHFCTSAAIQTAGRVRPTTVLANGCQ